MVTVPPSIDSPEDVLQFIGDRDLAYYGHLDEDEILDGHACDCDHSDGKFARPDDTRIYSGDKTGICRCDACGGYYGVVIPNWR